MNHILDYVPLQLFLYVKLPLVTLFGNVENIIVLDMI